MMAYQFRNKLKNKKIGIIPPQIDAKHLQADGGLLTPEEIARIPSDKTNTRLSKKDHPGLRYSVILIQDGDGKQRRYAVYGNNVVLGEGSYGKVKLAQDIETKTWVALKVVRDTHKKMKKESKILSKVSDLGLYVADPRSENERAKPDEDKKFHAIMKWIPGDGAFEFRQSRILDRSLRLSDLVIMAHNMVKGMNAMHEKGILHRDIKGENIMVDRATNDVQLIDFGLAKEINKLKKYEYYAGTERFMAPEVALQGENCRFSKKSDVFAMGVTLAEWFKLEIIEEKNEDNMTVPVKINETQQFHKIIKDKAMRDEVREIIVGMCQSDVDMRIDGEAAERRLGEIVKQLDVSVIKSHSVGVMNVEEYLKLSEMEKRVMRVALKNFDEVVLVYPDASAEITELSVALVKRELLQQGVRTMSEGFAYEAHDKANVIQCLNAHFNEKYAAHFQLLHVTTNSSLISPHFIGATQESKTIVVDMNKKSNDYKMGIELSVVEKSDIEKIKSALLKELLRVEVKYKKGSYQHKIREKCVMKFIKAIDIEAGKINYKQMTEYLSALQSSLQNVRHSNCFITLFSGKTETEKLVKKMAEDLMPKMKR